MATIMNSGDLDNECKGSREEVLGLNPGLSMTEAGRRGIPSIGDWEGTASEVGEKSGEWCHPEIR